MTATPEAPTDDHAETPLLRLEEGYPVEDLVEWPGNARIHDKATLDESVKDHGQFRSVLARELPDGRLQLLAGHGTREALMRAGRTRVDVEVRDVPTDGQARRIVLMENGSSRNASYDNPALLALLNAANADGGLAGTGFDQEQYLALLDEVGSENPFDGPGGGRDADDTDATPPSDDNTVTMPGDIWTCGAHRIMCGSATSADDLVTLTKGLAPGIVYTDPPYGIDIVQSNAVGGGGPVGGKAANPHGKVVKTTAFKPVIGDETTDTARDAFRLVFDTFPKALHVWWGANHYAGAIDIGSASCWLVWDKQNDGTNFADAELAWTNHRGAVRMFRHMWNGMLRATERGQRVHPNQKPVALAEWALDLLDPKRKQTVVLDVFGGSGSTLLGAHITNRRGFIMELDPAYCDVIVRRWQELTGELPYNERLGEPVDLIGRGA